MGVPTTVGAPTAREAGYRARMTAEPAPHVIGVVVSDPARTRGMSWQDAPLAAAAVAALAGWCEPLQVGPSGLDPALPLEQLCADAERIVVHDPLCPLLPAAVLAGCAASLQPGEAVVGVRPVTDTVKRVSDGWLGATLERDALAVLASPVVFAPELVQPLSLLLPTAGDLGDLAALVGALGGLCTLRGVEVPSAGRRVSDAEDLVLLAQLAGVQHRR